ncbi:calcium-transporting ATPase 8, plasma membrane-type-like isoform X1 [Prunus avium]|uniref:Calcium-transporting ATPase 8, plasma membrane-type-like isoform X1 n=1 Tax=Prunus avium TaxID=42229 RepID=A0A6P5SQ93_PRUAV|nr:calcium-transporting ATPase 8, plasma membrane-type-like isoform X1 [Prunus avium]
MCFSSIFAYLMLVEKGRRACFKRSPCTCCCTMNIPDIRTSTTGDFGIGREELVALTKNDDVGGLEQYGGIQGLECLLKTNLEDGINGEDADVVKRKSFFGANTYPAEKSKSFLTCLWEACHQDISLIIFIVVAVASSVMGLVTKGTRFGYWEEGGNVAVVVMVNIIVKAICKYSQSLIHNVKEEGRNMKVVVRGGKQVEVSICDIVVGDVIPLNIGDQVPAYGILITAQSLSIDTSRVNGDNNIVSFHASSGASRLKPGSEIADGSGTMLVTSVGICTKSELSQDIGNKTTLEEVLNEVATSIGNVGLAAAFIVMMVLLLRWFMYLVLIFGVKTKPRDVIEEVNQIIIIAFNIAVAAVPQGLPLAVTLTIFSATKRMVADNAFVRRPFACVTMAVVKNILCDKTVLTLNEDRCQPGVKEWVQLCQRDGVKVRMVTRDNLQTAKAIGLECGILDSDADATMPNHLFDGREFGELTDDRQRQECAKRIKVMAWCSPDVKLLFVQALKQSGEMVAVTGYVTEDAHALQQADIGLAMDIRGTEVAKESSDIIILDDSFATCVKAFKWGRSVHANIIKFMQLQLTVNVVALTTNFMAAVFYGHVPLNAVQVLWVNLIIVALVPLSLVTKPPADELMLGHLVKPGQPLKRYVKWKRLVFQGMYQIVAILIINFQGRSLLKSYNRGHAIKVKNTMIFNTFVVCQIIHQVEARKKGILSKPKKWITSNYLFMGIAGTILVSQFIVIEFLGKAFSTVALNQKEWQFSLTLGFAEMLFAIILFVKYLTHRN